MAQRARAIKLPFEIPSRAFHRSRRIRYPCLLGLLASDRQYRWAKVATYVWGMVRNEGGRWSTTVSKLCKKESPIPSTLGTLVNTPRGELASYLQTSIHTKIQPTLPPHIYFAYYKCVLPPRYFPRLPMNPHIQSYPHRCPIGAFESSPAQELPTVHLGGGVIVSLLRPFCPKVLYSTLLEAR